MRALLRLEMMVRICQTMMAAKHFQYEGGGSRPVPVVQAYGPKRKVPTTAPIPINDFDDVESWIRLVSEDVAGVLAGAAEPDEPTSDTSRAPWRK